MMIDFYTAPTPNGRKVSILLEELGLPYRVHAFDLARGDQKSEAFLSLNPNGKIPVIVDAADDGSAPVVLAESGAILLYLAQKTGSDLLPRQPQAHAATLQWLMFQMSGLGPTWGQLYYFRLRAPDPNPSAVSRFEAEAYRQLGVLNGVLSASSWLSGAGYSLADIAFYPWLVLAEPLGMSLEPYESIRRWMAGLSQREAVRRGMAIPS